MCLSGWDDFSPHFGMVNDMTANKTRKLKGSQPQEQWFQIKKHYWTLFDNTQRHQGTVKNDISA